MQFAMHPDQAVCNMHPAPPGSLYAGKRQRRSTINRVTRGHSSLHTPENET